MAPKVNFRMILPLGEEGATAGAGEEGASGHCARTGRQGRPKITGQEAILPDLVAFLLRRPDIKAVGKVEKVCSCSGRRAHAHTSGAHF